jgi:hypothetical protein
MRFILLWNRSAQLNATLLQIKSIDSTRFCFILLRQSVFNVISSKTTKTTALTGQILKFKYLHFVNFSFPFYFIFFNYIYFLQIYLFLSFTILTFYSLGVTVCTASFNIPKFYIMSTDYFYVLHVSKQNSEFCHTPFQWYGVYCAVRPESLNTTESVSSLKV